MGMNSFTMLPPSTEPQFGSIFWIWSLEAWLKDSYNIWVEASRRQSTPSCLGWFLFCTEEDRAVFCLSFRKQESCNSTYLSYHRTQGPPQLHLAREWSGQPALQCRRDRCRRRLFKFCHSRGLRLAWRIRVWAGRRAKQSYRWQISLWIFCSRLFQ